MMLPEETDHTPHAWLLGHVDVQIQAIDAFHSQGHVLPQDVGDGVCYAHAVLWLWPALRSISTA
jgi:hypothetical protein